MEWIEQEFSFVSGCHIIHEAEGIQCTFRYIYFLPDRMVGMFKLQQAREERKEEIEWKTGGGEKEREFACSKEEKQMKNTNKKNKQRRKEKDNTRLETVPGLYEYKHQVTTIFGVLTQLWCPLARYLCWAW
jgi:hypothetical protein